MKKGEKGKRGRGEKGEEARRFLPSSLFPFHFSPFLSFPAPNFMNRAGGAAFLHHDGRGI
jgi:hypothetical protein